MHIPITPSLPVRAARVRLQVVQSGARIGVVASHLGYLVMVAGPGPRLVVGQHRARRLQFVRDFGYGDEEAVARQQGGGTPDRAGHLEYLGVEQDTGVFALRYGPEEIGVHWAGRRIYVDLLVILNNHGWISWVSSYRAYKNAPDHQSWGTWALRQPFPRNWIGGAQACVTTGRRRWSRWAGEVALAGGGDDHDNHLALAFGSARDLQSGPDGGAGGDAGENALLLGKPPRHDHGILVGDGYDFVVYFGVQVVWNEPRADALDGVRPFGLAAEHGGGGRLDGDHVEGGLARLDYLADARDRPPVPTPATRMSPARPYRAKSPRPWCGDGFPGWQGCRTAAE